MIYPLMLAGGYECEILDDYDKENNKTFLCPSSAYKPQNSLKDKDFKRYIDSVMNEYQKLMNHSIIVTLGENVIIKYKKYIINI